MDAVEVRMRCIEAARQAVPSAQVLEVAEEWAAWILAGQPAVEKTAPETAKTMTQKVKDLF